MSKANSKDRAKADPIISDAGKKAKHKSKKPAAADDFSAMSFQDAMDMIDRDENERQQFMNSKSFSGIEQVEEPSLLSVTSYFQQGSSFPVPCFNNESTMFGASRSSFMLPTSLDDTAQSHSKGLRESNSLHRTSSQTASKSTKNDTIPIVDLVNAATSGQDDSKNPDLTRNDSLAKFFLGPQSDGMKKADIMDYVLDYCKRRASMRLSDASDITNSLSTTSSKSSHGRHDSGIGIGREDKDRHGDPKSRPEDVKRSSKSSTYSEDESNRMKSQVAASLKDKNKNEDSVLLAAGTTVKDVKALDVSDMSGIDGFERFKKNLSHGSHASHKNVRFRPKHAEDFEKKRLTVDERCSHPNLSPAPVKKVTDSTAGKHKDLPARVEKKRSKSSKHASTGSDISQPKIREKENKSPYPSAITHHHHMKETQTSMTAPPESLAVVPVVHSSTQPQQHQHAAGTPTCGCGAHQCTMQPTSQGLVSTSGLPIVIHIHLPVAPPVTGSVPHTVPTTSNKNS